MSCALLSCVPCPVHLYCSDDINIVAVLKAMGAESDQEVVQLIGPDEQLAALLMASIQVWMAVYVCVSLCVCRCVCVCRRVLRAGFQGRQPSRRPCWCCSVVACRIRGPNRMWLDSSYGAHVLLLLLSLLLMLSLLQECKSLGVFSQAQALDYLGSKLTQRGKGGFERRRKSKVRCD